MKTKLILIVILLLAAALRLYGLSNNPPHLTSDEAALGYNAYSILKTGRDEHGELHPIIFKSFGDWKPGLYIYLTVPFVALFGLNEFSTRIVGALSGIIAVLLVYLTSKRLFPKTSVPLFTAFSLAVLPWHVYFSRGAWEANLSLTLILGGIYFFLSSIREKSKYLLLSSMFFALSFWAYQGAKLGSSLTVLALSVIYFKDVIKIPKRNILISTVIGLFIISPVIISMFTGKTGRLEVYSVFSYERSPEIINEILIQNNEKVADANYLLYHSEPLNFMRGILSRWMNHYSGRFLFFEGDWSNPRHSIPNTGALLVVDSFLLILGLAFLARSKFGKATAFILVWLLIAPLPAALSRDSIHAVRALALTIPLALILGLGAYNFSNWIFSNKNRIALGLIFIGIYAFNSLYVLDAYTIHMPFQNSKDWHYGYRQMVEKVTPIQSKYYEVIIQQDYTQPYIFFLFYQKYDPTKYQAVAKDVYLPNEFGDVGFVSGFENLKFRDIYLPTDRELKNVLFVGDAFKLPESDISNQDVFNTVGEVKYLNNNSAFKLVETKQK